MAKFTAKDIVQKNSEKTQFTAYDILALKRDRESAQKQRDVERELNPIKMPALPNAQQTSQATTNKRTELNPLSSNVGSLSPFQTNMIAPTIQKTNVALSQPMNNLAQLEKFTSPDYKLSDTEKEQAKQLIKDFESSQKRIWSPSDPKRTEQESDYANKIYLLQNKMNPVASFTMGLIDSFPTTGITKWIANKLGATEATEPFTQTSEVTRASSPVAYTAGDITGMLAQYGIGSKVAQSIPAVASATGRAGQALAKLPVLSKAGAQPIANVLGDMTLDVALDTIPEAASNISSGESAGTVVGDIAKNLGLNLAMNIGGEALGTVLWKLAKKKSAKQIEQLLTDAINNTTKEELPTVLAQTTKQALNEPIEVLEVVSKNLDTVGNVPKTEVPTAVAKTTIEEPAVLKIKKAEVIDTAKKISEDFKQSWGNPDRIFENSVKKEVFEKSTKEIDSLINQYQKAISENDFELSKKYAMDIIEKTGDLDASLKGSSIKTNVKDETVSLQKQAIKQNLSGKSILLDKSTADYIRRSTGLTIPEFSAKYGRPNNIFLTTNPTNARAISLDNSQDILESLQNAGIKINLDNAQDQNLSVIQAIMENTGKNENIYQTIPYNSEELWSDMLEKTKQIHTFADETKKLVGEGTIAKVKKEKPLVMAEDTGLVAEKQISQGPIKETLDMKERGYAESIREKTDLPDTVKQEFIDKPELYTQLSNKTTRETAENIMASNDIKKSEDIYRELLNKKDPVSIPLGYNIAKSYADAGDINKSVDILREMSKELTSAGQFSQAAAIYLMQSNPMTALRYFEKDLSDLNKKGFEKFGKKWNDIKLTDDELKAFADIQDGDSEAIKGLYKQIYDRMRKEIPSTTWEKFVELTKVSMLLNPRTQIRNVLSNALLLPVSSLSNKVSALGQNAVSMVAKDFKPTQAVIVSKDSKKLSEQAWNTVKDTILKDSDKWDDVKGVMRDRQVFKGSKASQFIDTVTGGAITKANRLMGKETDPSTLETLRNLTYYLLEKGDDVFVKKNFENRLASFIQARNIKSLEDIPEEAYTIATLEALKATFKDTNRLTEMFSSIKKTTGKTGEVLLPFTKTPANLAVRSYEYSPASIVKAFNNVKTGDVGKLMDDLGKTFVGTAGIGLGAYLFNKGFITGDYSKDPDEAAFQKQQGYIPYAVKVGDSYVSYDWAQPSSSSLLIGTAIAQGIDEESKVIDNITSAGTTAANQWMELSPLQSFADVFGGYGTPAENFLNEVVEFPQRLVPSALGSTARATDTTQRSTYSKDNMLKTQVDTLKSKIPGLSKTLPATYDTWGGEVKRNDTTGQAIIGQYLNPGTLGNANVSPIDSEISKLYTETGSNKVFPKKAERTIKVGEETTTLDNEQYSKYQKSLGEKSYQMAEKFIQSKAYKNMPADLSTEVLDNIYSFANALAKEDMTDYDASSVSTFKKPYEIYKEKGLDGVVDYLTLKSNLNSSKVSDIFNAVSTTDLSTEDMGYYLDMLSSDSVSKETVKNKYGNTGLYDFYSIKASADADTNGTIAKGELINYFNKSDLSRMEKKFYYELLVSAKNNPYN